MEDVLQIYYVPNASEHHKKSKIVSKRSASNYSEFHVSQSYSLTLPAKITSVFPEEKKLFVNADLRKYLANSSTARSTLSRCSMITIIDPSRSHDVAFNYVIAYIDHEAIITGICSIY